ncbi:DotU family type IV/VI secretion system protein [Silvibacterium sp.]|uniref:DotU family type IV/VI secretion system protein n=1 Tax=Silvibacterium sp. TaxID=1964179 RepID=UPI0039E64D08
MARLRRMVEEQAGDTIRPAVMPQPVAAGAAALEADLRYPDVLGREGKSIELLVWNEIARYLDQKMYEVRAATSSFFHDLQEELVYLMAAFADETFVCLLAWSGKDYWASHLMEQRLFRTQVAGQEIYRRMDALLARQDFGAEELTMVYLTVLALGFRGRFLRDPAAVDAYRKRLYDRLLLTNPDLRRQSPRLFPEAYQHTIVEGAPVRLPEPRRWWLTAAAVVGAWLVLSSVAWFMLTHSTQELIATTAQSLQRIATEQALAAGGSGKWRVAAAPPQENGFLLKVPPRRASDRDVGRPTTVLVGVRGVNGASPGSAASLRNWLSHGTVRLTHATDGAAPESIPVTAVTLAEAPPDGIADAGAAQYFLLDLPPDQLEAGPQLSFPAASSFGLEVGSVMLVTPDISGAGDRPDADGTGTP